MKTVEMKLSAYQLLCVAVVYFTTVAFSKCNNKIDEELYNSVENKKKDK